MIIAKTVEKITGFIYKYIFFFLPNDHPWDYIAHFIVNFVGVLAILFFLKVINVPPRISFYVAISVMLLLSIVKETMDLYLGKTDGIADMTANILGIAFAVLIIFLAVKINI